MNTDTHIGEEPEAKPCDHIIGWSLAIHSSDGCCSDGGPINESDLPRRNWDDDVRFDFCPKCGTKLSTELAQERSQYGLGGVLIEKQGQDSGSPSKGQDFLQGVVDSVHLENRALSEKEIEDLYREGL